MIPIALGVFYFTGIEWLIELKPWYGALAMSFSSVFVVLNALRLNLFNSNKKSNCRPSIELDNSFFDNIITKKEEKKDMEELVINVNGMMCNHCKKHVEDACKAVNGVTSAEANLDKKNVTVKYNGSVNKADLVKAIIDAGYEAE